MKINWKLLILCIAIPLAGGGVAALLTGGGMEVFESESAAFIASGMAVSCSLDNSLHLNGNFFLFDLNFRGGKRRSTECIVYLCLSADSQFLLADLFL